MPCRSDYMEPTPDERAELDRLTRENDQLREMVLRLYDGGKLTVSEVRLVNARQVKHRKEDLARLEKTFREALMKIPPKQTADLIHLRLGRVVTADPTKPLEPQLGFNPDSV